MALSKEDGSLDVNLYNNMTNEEFAKEFNKLTRGQVAEFWREQSLNESHGGTEPVYVDYTLEDELNHGAVIATSFMNKIRQKYGVM